MGHQWEKNSSLNVIYWGLHHMIWVIDKLDLNYLDEMRNQMCEWTLDLEKRYKWLGESQRSLP